MTNQINTLFAVLMMLLLMIVTRGHDNWLSSMLHLPDSKKYHSKLVAVNYKQE
jgi:hypothetical protein